MPKLYNNNNFICNSTCSVMGGIAYSSAQTEKVPGFMSDVKTLTPSHFLLPCNCKNDLLKTPLLTAEQMRKWHNKLVDELCKRLFWNEYVPILREREREKMPSIISTIKNKKRRVAFRGKHAEVSMVFGTSCQDQGGLWLQRSFHQGGKRGYYLKLNFAKPSLLWTAWHQQHQQ